MAGPAQEQALPLLALANNHGDLAVKLSSLKQVKDILLSAEPSHAAELFPYLVELQSSPETLVRKYLLEVIDEIGAKSMEHLSILWPILLTFLKDNNSMVAKQSIITGTKIFCSVLEDLPLQFQRRGIVERWLEELWMWMVKYKDAVFSIIFEAGSVGPQLLAIKFLETYILHFTHDTNDSEKVAPEVTTRHGRAFNISMLVDRHPVLDLPALVSDANRYFGILLDSLRSAGNLRGSLTISVVNSLALIARKRPMYYSSVLPALLDFNVNSETVKGRHTLSIHYSLKTAFLGFMRCTQPVIVESRERLLKALRAMNAGDAADQVIRQVDKIKRSNERASWDLRLSKDDQQSDQLPILRDMMSKRLAPMENEDSNNTNDVTYKRLRYGGPHGVTDSRLDVNDAGQDPINGISPKVPLLDQDPTPLEQMIAMIGALIAEGERGVDSLEILISNIHPDLLADIVITNMKHFPRNPPPFPPTTFGNLPFNRQSDSPSLSQGVASNGSMSMQILGLAAQLPVSSSGMMSLPSSDMPTSSNLPSDSKRDPRRDPRRLDPRRMVAPVEVLPPSFVDNSTTDTQCHALEQDFDDSSSFSQTPAPPYLHSSESVSVSPMPKTTTDLNLLECSVKLEAGQWTPKVEVQDMEAKEIITDSKGNAALYTPLSTLSKVEDTVAHTSLDAIMLDEAYSPSSQELDELSPPISNLEASEIVVEQLPVLPPYMELNEDHQRTVIKLAFERIIDEYQNIQRTDFTQTQMALLARLFAQIDAGSDVVMMMQKRIVSDYQKQKGHELVMHVLYHIRALMLSDSFQNSSSAASLYENFLLEVAKSLLDAFPATDKSFSRLLGEVPYLPESVLRLLDDLCSRSHSGVDGRDGDRVTQGLGVLWSLILGRPLNREACLGIALKCAVHSLDDVRAKAIRLVANKLYAMSNVAENIEEFATNMFLSAVEQRVPETGILQSVSHKQRIGQVGSQETSVSVSQISDPGVSENDTIKVAEESTSDSAISFSQAQRLVSLFFALCAKKPSLLQLVFNNYARASKAVKQAVHRHTPVLIRALGSSYSELLQIISDPPQGSEQLLTQVLHVLSEGKTPTDLVAAVKRLYDTKLKDASILIPILSSFSRDEVLPIFPHLVNLPLDKFQTALAHVLQGSSHTGPALTPAEVLVAIHDIIPDRDGLPLKKITDACSACFEQRTVFTQQVLAKALNQMVDQTPLPLLFMRTVIQAIDAFPTLVHFVMEILSKLVNKQVWRMPKLWVGFLKCISQTQPHSFSVLLQLPSPQLENALNKYSNLRSPLSAFVNQSNVRSSLPRSTLVLLGIAT